MHLGFLAKLANMEYALPQMILRQKVITHSSPKQACLIKTKSKWASNNLALRYQRSSAQVTKMHQTWGLLKKSKSKRSLVMTNVWRISQS